MTTVTQVNLWSESTKSSSHEILGSFLRAEFEKEQIVILDLSYLGQVINNWWSHLDKNESSECQRASLRTLILENLKSEHYKKMQSLGAATSNIAAVFLERVFFVADKELALLAHEVMADLAGLVDIKYPYEEHKELSPKVTDNTTSDWGRGLGVIRPHSDDLYESREINGMCLTVCRDISCTPTWFWLIKDVVACLSDEELGIFAMGDANYFSGANVEGKVFESSKPILRRDKHEGVGLRLDFRIDEKIGPRMQAIDTGVAQIFEKLKTSLRFLKPISSTPATGSMSLLSNYKVLHGRAALPQAMLTEGRDSRILFRSKGFMRERA